MFFGRSEKQDGRPALWLAETFSTSPLKSLNRIQRNLAGIKISTSSTKFVFFSMLIGKNKMAIPASEWLIKFRFLLWNRWTEFKETWPESRYRCPLPSFCFSDQSKNTIAARPPINWDIIDFFSCPLHSFQRLPWAWVARKLKPHWIRKDEVEKAMTEYHIVTKTCTEGKQCKTKSHLRAVFS